jgi:coenzyme Q-binding protein COQ10
MPKRNYVIEANHNLEDLFDLVADVSSYPEFIPWVKAIRIIKSQEDILFAELLLQYKIFRKSYVSKISFTFKTEILIELVDGPFDYLHSKWQFKDSGVYFDIDFKLKSSLLEQLIESKFDHYADQLIKAFVNRANQKLKYELISAENA